jgi:hypothetical protein
MQPNKQMELQSHYGVGKWVCVKAKESLSDSFNKHLFTYYVPGTIQSSEPIKDSLMLKVYDLQF